MNTLRKQPQGTEIDAVACTQLIKCLSERPNDALQVLQIMNERGLEPNSITYTTLLASCTVKLDLFSGRLVHAHALKQRRTPLDIHSVLLNMYIKCGETKSAYLLFSNWYYNGYQFNVKTWTMMISALIDQGDASKGLDLFDKMIGQQVMPDAITYISLLKACAILLDLARGEQIHQEIINKQVEITVPLQSALISFYVKCGKPDCAFALFDQMKQKQMQPSSFTYISLLAACANTKNLFKGRLLTLFGNFFLQARQSMKKYCKLKFL